MVHPFKRGETIPYYRDRRMLLLSSYCSRANPSCTQDNPCVQCLEMSNVFLVGPNGMQYIGQLREGAPLPIPEDAKPLIEAQQGRKPNPVPVKQPKVKKAKESEDLRLPDKAIKRAAPAVAATQKRGRLF